MRRASGVVPSGSRLLESTMSMQSPELPGSPSSFFVSPIAAAPTQARTPCAPLALHLQTPGKHPATPAHFLKTPLMGTGRKGRATASTPLPTLKTPVSRNGERESPVRVVDPFASGHRLNFPPTRGIFGTMSSSTSELLSDKPHDRSIDVVADLFPFELKPRDKLRLAAQAEKADSQARTGSPRIDAYWRARGKDSSPSPRMRRPGVLFDPETERSPSNRSRAHLATPARSAAQRTDLSNITQRSSPGITAGLSRSRLLRHTPRKISPLDGRPPSAIREPTAGGDANSVTVSLTAVPRPIREVKSILKPRRPPSELNPASPTFDRSVGPQQSARKVHFSDISGESSPVCGGTPSPNNGKVDVSAIHPVAEADEQPARQLDFDLSGSPAGTASPPADAKDKGRLFDVVTSAIREGDTRAVRDVVMRAGDEALKARSVDNGTVLMEAVIHDRIGIVQLLLRAQADPDSTNRHGVTPLMFAAWSDRDHITRMLLEAKADPNARSCERNQTALQIARSRGASKVEYVLASLSSTPTSPARSEPKASIRTDRMSPKNDNCPTCRRRHQFVGGERSRCVSNGSLSVKLGRTSSRSPLSPLSSNQMLGHNIAGSSCALCKVWMATP